MIVPATAAIADPLIALLPVLSTTGRVLAGTAWPPDVVTMVKVVDGAGGLPRLGAVAFWFGGAAAPVKVGTSSVVGVRLAQSDGAATGGCAAGDPVGAAWGRELSLSLKTAAVGVAGGTTLVLVELGGAGAVFASLFAGAGAGAGAVAGAGAGAGAGLCPLAFGGVTSPVPATMVLPVW